MVTGLAAAAPVKCGLRGTVAEPECPTSSGATHLDKDQSVIRVAGGHDSAARTEPFWRGVSWPLHPFLFGAASVFSLYAANLRETTLGDIGAALGGVFALALVLFLGFGMLLRRFGPRAAILASVVLVIGLHYADLALWLNRYIGAAHPEEVAWPWALAAIAVALGAVQLARGSHGAAEHRSQWRRLRAAGLSRRAGGCPCLAVDLRVPASRANGVKSTSAAAHGPVTELPDIYYFIFDRYASQEELSQEYDLDNRNSLDG